MSEFICPPHECSNDELPVVFLAGPVQGAPDWQSDMAAKLLRRIRCSTTLSVAPMPKRRASKRVPQYSDRNFSTVMLISRSELIPPTGAATIHTCGTSPSATISRSSMTKGRSFAKYLRNCRGLRVQFALELLDQFNFCRVDAIEDADIDTHEIGQDATPQHLLEQRRALQRHDS